MQGMHWVALKRRERGLTQSRLADLILVSQSTISRIETGKIIPNVNITRNLAKALNYTGKTYSLIDAETRTRRTFNIIDQRTVKVFGNDCTILVTDDSCILEIVGKSK